jgi:hypothetical protein
VRRAPGLRLSIVIAVACIAVGGVLATTGAAQPVAHSAATLAGSVKRALKLGKRANRKAKSAVRIARRAEKNAARSGPAGPQGERGPQGVAGANGASGTNGTNGTAGAVGATGATGATGPQGVTGLWEVIEATATGSTRVRGPATGTGRIGNGAFYVSFDQDITGCGYIASVGSISDQTAPGLFATVEQRSGAPNDVLLRSFDGTGGLVDPGLGNGFHVAVLC